MFKFLFYVALVFYAVTSRANGIEELHAFISGTRSAQADFTQTILNKNGTTKQTATGIMIFARPGKFRWTYQTPFKQIIMGDGNKVYLYDVDLAQVTIKKIDASLGSSPAALLAGNDDIEKFYTLRDDGQHDGLAWLSATPKNSESTFKLIEMGFDHHQLLEMKIHDNFGLTTVLQFRQLQRNPVLPAATFKFVAPEGVDVISDSK